MINDPEIVAKKQNFMRPRDSEVDNSVFDEQLDWKDIQMRAVGAHLPRYTPGMTPGGDETPGRNFVKNETSYGMQLLEPNKIVTKRKITKVEDEIAFEKKILMEERQRKDYINRQGELGDLD